MTPPRGPWATVGLSFLQAAPWFAALLIWTWWSWDDGDAARGVDFAILAIAFAAWLLVALPVVLYAQLQREKAWGRWRNMLRILPLLRFANFFTRLRVLAYAYDFDEARALAGLGRVDEAEARVRKHAGATDIERGRHAGMLVGIYETAHRYDDGLRCAREHVALCPSDPSAHIDLAMRFVLRFHDPRAAREALEGAAGRERSEHAAAFERLVVGIVLLEEGEHTAALVELDAARVGLRGFGLPGVDELCQLHRAWALAGIDRLDESAAALAAARPMFAARGEAHVLAYVTSRVRDILAARASVCVAAPVAPE
jgi:hypothetical protein